MWCWDRGRLSWTSSQGFTHPEGLVPALSPWMCVLSLPTWGVSPIQAEAHLAQPCTARRCAGLEVGAAWVPDALRTCTCCSPARGGKAGLSSEHLFRCSPLTRQSGNTAASLPGALPAQAWRSVTTCDRPQQAHLASGAPPASEGWPSARLRMLFLITFKASFQAVAKRRVWSLGIGLLPPSTWAHLASCARTNSCVPLLLSGRGKAG